MCACQRIVRKQRVIEFGVEPVRCCMTVGAGVGQSKLHVAWIGAEIEIRRMTGIAVFRQGGEVAVRMALCATNGGMSAGQWKHRCVIESGRRPSCGCMT